MSATALTMYGPGTVGPRAGEIARAIQAGFTATARGERVSVHRYTEPLDHEQLRQWFRDKLDGLINLKAGLRSDGAPAKRACACLHCMGRCDCALKKIPERGGRVCGYGCCAPWGGRRWETDWEASARRDSRAARDRVAVRRFETDVVRKRLGHLHDNGD